MHRAIALPLSPTLDSEKGFIHPEDVFDRKERRWQSSAVTAFYVLLNTACTVLVVFANKM